MWIPKSSMVCSHWQCERCAFVECGKPRWVCNALKKWTKDKQNVGVVGWANNQMFVVGPTQDQRHVHMACEGTSIKSVANSCLCKRFVKEAW
jgi:hypothetical protein